METIHHGSPGETEDTCSTQWQALTARIRKGDDSAAREFRENFAPGAQVLLRHRLGSIGVEALAEEAMAGAIEEVRKGWIRTPRDLVHFLHEVLRRQYGPEPERAARQGASERARIREMADRIAAALELFPIGDRRLLERYYRDGESVEAISRESGVAAEQFLELKNRLMRAVERAEHRPAKPVFKARKAAAGG